MTVARGDDTLVYSPATPRTHLLHTLHTTLHTTAPHRTCTRFAHTVVGCVDGRALHSYHSPPSTALAIYTSMTTLDAGGRLLQHHMPPSPGKMALRATAACLPPSWVLPHREAALHYPQQTSAGQAREGQQDAATRTVGLWGGGGASYVKAIFSVFSPTCLTAATCWL